MAFSSATLITSVSDILVPQIWLPYTIQRTMILSELVSSGIIQADPIFDALATSGGQTANMPFWNDIVGADQVITSSTPLTTAKIGTGQDLAVFHNRANAWASHDLAGLLAGSDPMKTIGDLVAAFWARALQAQTLQTLAGVFASTATGNNPDSHSMNANSVWSVHHTSGGAGGASSANYFTALTFIDACQLLGDAKSKLTGLIVHSKTEAYLRKQNLIDFIPASEQGQLIKTFQGLRLIVDDGMPIATVDGDLVYTTYIFGQGAFALGVDPSNPVPEGAAPGSTWQLEFGRDSLGNTSHFINRRRFILHPRGVKWTSNTMTLESPLNTELAMAANWTQVYQTKAIRMVQFNHNLG